MTDAIALSGTTTSGTPPGGSRSFFFPGKAFLSNPHLYRDQSVNRRAGVEVSGAGLSGAQVRARSLAYLSLSGEADPGPRHDVPPGAGPGDGVGPQGQGVNLLIP